MELRPHQKQALNDLSNGKILRGGVGSGKTLVAVAYYLAREAPRDVFVITTAKKRDSLDWEKEFAGLGVGKYQDATIHGVLTVDSWNNIANYKDVRDAFFIFDEQRVVGSGSWAKSFIKIARTNNWILLSATPGDTWLDYIPVFVANGFYKNRTEFVREHVIYTRHGPFPKVDRYISVGRLVRNRNSILVEMPFERHTIRLPQDVPVSYDEELMEKVIKKRWNVFKEKPLRDVAEMFGAARRVVNSDPTRLSSVKTLMEKHPRLIVFYNFDYELELLRTLADDFEMPTNERSTESGYSTRSKKVKLDEGLIDSASSTKTADELREGVDECQDLMTDDILHHRQNDISEKKLPGTSSTISSTSLEKSKLFSEELSFKSSPTSSTRRNSKSGAESKDSSPLIETHHQANALPGGIQNQATKSSVSGSISAGMEKSGPQQTTRPTVQIAERNDPNPPTLNNGVKSGGWTIAEWNGHKHEPVPTTDRWVYLVQYVAGSEGWNCIETDAMVMYSLTYSYKNWDQAFGRIDRMNTPFTKLHYYILMSDSWIDQAIRRSLKAKKSFNESAYMKNRKAA